MSFVVLYFLSSVYANDHMTFWQKIKPPKDVSINGHLIDYLFNFTTGLTLFFFILVCLGLFGFSYLYSYKKNPKPYYTHGNKKPHLIFTFCIGAVVFLGVDLNIAHISGRDFANVFVNFPDEKKEDVVKIEVLGQQWMWSYRYAGIDGVFNTDDDIVRTNDLRLPTGKKVVMQFTSKDVIHAFFFTGIRQKIDVMPGRVSKIWFELTTPGDYEIACAEMCGTHHYKMASKLKIYSPEDYNNWLKESQKIALVENDLSNADSFWGWQWE